MSGGTGELPLLEAAIEAVLIRIEALEAERDAGRLDEILRSHTIECTGPGEVTCRCREGGWMSLPAHRQHLIDALFPAARPSRPAPTEEP